MWEFVEEPAREATRGWAGARKRPTQEAGETIALAASDPDSAEPVDVPGDDGKGSL